MILLLMFHTFNLPTFLFLTALAGAHLMSHFLLDQFPVRKKRRSEEKGAKENARQMIVFRNSQLNSKVRQRQEKRRGII